MNSIKSIKLKSISQASSLCPRDLLATLIGFTVETEINTSAAVIKWKREKWEMRIKENRDGRESSVNLYDVEGGGCACLVQVYHRYDRPFFD
jgi:hypothetical protein